MSKPLISVIMSVYNNRAFVELAVKSILNQTFRDFEFLITDDGSTDGSSAIIDELAAGDDRIRVFHQANTGLTVALNQMVSESHGEYIARMDADDLSHPLRFEKQRNYLMAHPSCGVVGTGSLDIDEHGRVISGYVLPDDHDFLLRRLERGINVYKHGSIMVRKKVFMAQRGPYRFRYGQDYDLYLRLSRETTMGMVHEVLFLYRVHSAAIQGVMSPYRARQVALMLDLHRARCLGLSEPPYEELEKLAFPASLNLSDMKDAESLFASGRISFQTGSMDEARRCFLATCRYKGYQVRSIAYLMLTLLPIGLGKLIKKKLIPLRDELRDYRVHPNDYADILATCYYINNCKH